MKKLILLYIAAWIIPVVVYCIVLFGSGANGNRAYWGETCSYIFYLCDIVLTLCASYVAMKFFSFRVIKAKLAENSAIRFIRLSAIRIAVVGFAEIFNIITYFIIGESSALYLMAILLVALFFCLPQSPER